MKRITISTHGTDPVPLSVILSSMNLSKGKFMLYCCCEDISVHSFIEFARRASVMIALYPTDPDYGISKKGISIERCLIPSDGAVCFSQENTPDSFVERNHLEYFSSRKTKPFRLKTVHYTVTPDIKSETNWTVL